MRTERKLLEVLRSTTPEQRFESLSWFVYNLFGSTLPIWLGGYILLPIFGRHFNWIEYSQHGELALYSAAFLAPTLRLIGKDVEDSVFVRRQVFLFFGWIFLTAAVALYSGVISAAGMPPSTLRVNTSLIFGVSMFLFVVSVILSSFVRLIDYQRIQPKQIFDVQYASKTRLDRDFDQTTPKIAKPSTMESVDGTNQQLAPDASEPPLAASGHPDQTLANDVNAEEGTEDATGKN